MASSRELARHIAIQTPAVKLAATSQVDVFGRLRVALLGVDGGRGQCARCCRGNCGCGWRRVRQDSRDASVVLHVILVIADAFEAAFDILALAESIAACVVAFVLEYANAIDTFESGFTHAGHSALFVHTGITRSMTMFRE